MRKYIQLITALGMVLLTPPLLAAHRGDIAPRRMPNPPDQLEAQKSQPTSAPGLPPGYKPASTMPPPVMREFRAAWIPTVGNSCWPSKPGLSTGQQKAELVALLNRAAELKLNAVIFQVRPACDALYRSDLEPWSEYLTGIQGRAPSPYYDPLEFAVAEAHKRGLELHAWFNPYRARHNRSVSPVAANHVSKLRPDLVRRYDDYLWLDPGERDVQDYSARVVLDVVKRYDIDAVHFDDYFYPYPKKDSARREIPFPDDASWKRFGVASGLSRNDWRRRNVDQFIERIYASIHAEKPWVKFGLSPFGIWRPKSPPGIDGLDAYDKLYADARKWLQAGWCDYLAPQLYWSIAAPEQSFPVLLKWWNAQNSRQRHLWPGLNSLNVGTEWPPAEITNQIALTRKLIASPGQIHWSASALIKNAGLAAALAKDAYRTPALIPRYPWLGDRPPATPLLRVTQDGESSRAVWSSTNQPALWVVQTKQFGDWKTQILPPGTMFMKFDLQPELIAVSAVDRCGNQSSPVVLQLVK